jgi:acetoin utilization deacetylase AcuC-like enzyme
MALSAAAYADLVAGLRDLARELCGGRLVLTLEGGYDLGALAWCVRNSFEVLLDEAPTPDPLGRHDWTPAAIIDDLLSAVAEAHRLEGF